MSFDNAPQAVNSTVGAPGAPRKKKEKLAVTEFHLRNDDPQLSYQFTKLKAFYPDLSKNSLLQKCLKVGVSSLLKEALPPITSITATIKEAEKSLEKAIQKQADRIVRNTLTMTVMLKINESIVSTIFQSFEYFLRCNDFEVPEEALADFRNSLPEAFEKQKNEYLKKLFEEEQI